MQRTFIYNFKYWLFKRLFKLSYKLLLDSKVSVHVILMTKLSEHHVVVFY